MKCETNLQQNEEEFAEFLSLIRSEKVGSYLEIGSKHGGTWWRATNQMPVGSRTVSVDLPQGDGSFKASRPNLEECYRELKKRFDAYLFLGDSTDAEIVEKVSLLGPFDLVFIDANHTEPFVRRDWANYGKLGKIVAFHDIGWIPRPEPSKKMPIEVPKVWNELKSSFRHREIRKCERDNGIGIVWRS
jgi:predicted O-methyltransferase YrrM